MSTTLYAGYVLPAVFDALNASGMLGRDALRALLRSWCVASVEDNAAAVKTTLSSDPVLLTAANMISRGLPTLPSVETERVFHKAFGRTSVSKDETGRIISRGEGLDASFSERLLDALKAVDPRIDGGALPDLIRKSKAAGLAEALTAPFVDLFGPAITQLLDVGDSGKSLLLPFMYPHSGMRGIRAIGSKKSDSDIAGGLDSSGWYTLPVIAGDSVSLKNHLKTIRAMVPSDAVPLVVQNENLFSNEGAEAAQLALTPIAVARLQRVLIDLLIQGKLDLASESWKLTVVERDIPGAALAIEDFQRLLNALFQLEGKDRRLPAIDLTVCSLSEFHTSPLHAHASATLLRDITKLEAADCLIDASVFMRTGQVAEEVKIDAPVHLVVRTARHDSSLRTFFLREPAAWKALPTGNGNPAKDDRVLHAAEHLLQRCFRFTSFRSGQLRLLTHTLQQKHWLASMPAGSGKSLMYQFAGLMQPALSFVLEPLAALAMDQQDSLQERFIDTVGCLHESLGRDARESVRKRIVNGEVLYCIATAELFRNDETVDALNSVQHASLYFAQCVVDEAHSLSEWSHDHRLTMQGALGYAVSRLRAGKKQQLPLRLLTASTSYDVLHDLQRQFTAIGQGYVLRSDQLVAIPSALNDSLRYYVLPSTAENDNEDTIALRKKETLGKLFKRLPTFFEELLAEAVSSEQLQDFAASEFYAASRAYAGVVFCPYQAGPLGVTNRFSSVSTSNAVVDSLSQKYLKTGIFVGKDDGTTRVGRQPLAVAAEERQRFKTGESNVLVATRAFGIGSHNRRIRYTVHLNMPPGLERFVQESGRAGHDGRLALSALLYTPPTQAESPDAIRARSILSTTYSSVEREKQLIHDLLREISYPEDSNTSRIANIIADEYGIGTRVSYWQRGLDERMYLHAAGNSIGYIDLVTQEIVPEPKYTDQEHAGELLGFAYDNSLTAAGSGPSLSSWVSATYPSDIDDGIARQMADFDSGAEFTLRIGFENDREPILTKIHKLLWHDAEIEIHRKLLSEVTTESWSEFCSALEHRSGRAGAFASLNKELEERVVQLFNQLRSRTDTERVINRLMTLGAVKDYSINPAARKFSLVMLVRTEDEYRESLERYMETFLPPTHVQRLLGPLHSYPGETTLERCLYFLVEFAHQNAIHHRMEGVDIMEAACAYGLQNGPGAFREYVNLSLTAKYARIDEIPAALSSNDRFGVLEHYVHVLEEDGTGSILENASHLKASCSLLSAKMKGEPVVRAMEAFAALVLAQSQKDRSTLSVAFVERVVETAAASGLKGQDYLDAIAPLMQRFRRYLDADETTQLRTGLERGEAEIKTQKALEIAPLAASGREKAGDMPDITAEKPLPQKQQVNDRTEDAEVKRSSSPSAPPKKKKDIPPAREKEELPKQDQKKAKTSRAETEKAVPEASKAVPEASKTVPEASKTVPEAPKIYPEVRKTVSPKKTSAPVQSQVPALEDFGDDSDIDALLADIENMISKEDGGTDTQSVMPKQPVSKKTKLPPAKTKSSTVTEAAKPTPSSRISHGQASTAGVRKSESKLPVEKKAEAKKTKAAPPQKPKPAVDPVLKEQVKWLQSFNTRFLKDYES